jgi:hypothetical protein
LRILKREPRKPGGIIQASGDKRPSTATILGQIHTSHGNRHDEIVIPGAHKLQLEQK